MKENILKLAITAGVGAFLAYFQILVIPLIVLIALMVVDYGTGMAKAYINADLCSRTGIIGIIKKLGYLLIVVVGMATDYLLATAVATVDITLPQNFAIALLVTVWLIVNELISILENVAIMGVPVPKFLTNIINKLKVAVESKGEENE